MDNLKQIDVESVWKARGTERRSRGPGDSENGAGKH
jgi:hypothetical protein